MAQDAERGDALRLGGLAVLGIGTAILGMGDLIARVGIGWGVAVLLLAVGILYSAFGQGPAAHGLPFLCGAILSGLGVLAYLLGRSHGYALASLLLGLATLVVALVAHHMRTHPA